MEMSRLQIQVHNLREEKQHIKDHVGLLLQQHEGLRVFAILIKGHFGQDLFLEK